MDAPAHHHEHTRTRADAAPSLRGAPRLDREGVVWPVLILILDLAYMD